MGLTKKTAKPWKAVFYFAPHSAPRLRKTPSTTADGCLGGATSNLTRWACSPENPNSLENLVVNLRFPDQYFDKESGLSYNYFRDYDGTAGRYV